MIKVVIDTEVYITALLSSSGYCRRIINLWMDDKFISYTSPEILNEIYGATRSLQIKRRHHINDLGIKRYVKYLKFFSIQTPGELSLKVINGDFMADIFLSCGVEAGADFIVTKYPLLLKLGSYEGIRILSPADFTAVITGI